ncbi:hypothetical protein [Plebeiibacterium sediminum]|uniref:Cytochrome c domain-containing protein n=1 Tax=Plebeiibacterium sediminum TaxID=2992112 RepID=A0AAE3SDW3_9BACT|nr:hypothetical protein [Plebeiobacterium sediminum]MCW3785327.1 hypothetical protein [Plebeiobacterium sediminum]
MYINRIIYGITALLLVACTHPYEPDVANTWNVNVELSFTDPEFWPENQQIRVGLFTEESSRNPMVSKAINQPESNEPFQISISDVEEGDYTAQVYITENGIYKVSLSALNHLSIYSDTMEKTDAIQLITFNRVQKQVLNNCVVCHGSSAGDIAADLNLTQGYSYENLVGITSYKRPEMVRVYAGSAEFSYLIHVLNEDINFNHAASSSASDEDIQLVMEWIEEGALDN